METPPTIPLLVCPACGYDVGRTLRDGIDRCPECGGAISEALCRDAGEADGGWRVVGVYLVLCFVGPVVTFGVAAAFGPAGFGRFSQTLSVLAMLTAYAGGTACILGWPTGAGYVVERCVPSGRPGRGALVFFAMLILGGVLMLASVVLSAMVARWIR